MKSAIRSQEVGCDNADGFREWEALDVAHLPDRPDAALGDAADAWGEIVIRTCSPPGRRKLATSTSGSRAWTIAL
jgi:hypothetical protein